MIKVAGCWELGWTAPWTEYDLWSYPLRDLGVDEWIMTPITGIMKEDVIEMIDLESVIKANPDLIPIVIEEDGKYDLQEFKHPDNALYILGRVGYSISYNAEISVRIKTVLNKGLLWSHQAISIVLYDRMIKCQ